jgi:MFS family permease
VKARYGRAMPFDRAALPIVISGCLSLAFAMGVGRFAYTPILPLMLEEDLLSIGTGGTIASVHFIGYAIGAFLASRLAAAGPETLLVSLLAVGLSTLGMGVWENTQLWLAARFVAGLCSAFVLVSVSTMSIRHLAEIGRPELQGWVFAGVGAGIAVVGILVLGFLAAGTRSGAVWLVFGLLSLAGTGVVWKLDGRHSRPVSQPFDGQVGGGRKPVSWRLALPYGAMGLGYIIPATYLPVMAREAVSSPLVYGWGWPLFRRRRCGFDDTRRPAATPLFQPSGLDCRPVRDGRWPDRPRGLANDDGNRHRRALRRRHVHGDHDDRHEGSASRRRTG